ncbi:MAG: hypothetical protein DRI24_11925 [Deltaproteobacteria bacterium]|nr:MAG: hypothetical protein DRI24_11925 [Deltaproteobacteria bacterium]
MAKRTNFDEEKVFGGKFELFRDTWMSNGFNKPTQSKLEFKDMMATSNASEWLPKTLETILREPVEPVIMIPQLLDNIAWAGAKMTFPSLGGIIAADIGEAQAYPERQLQIGPGTMTASTGKSGLMIRLTEEMRQDSQFDLINMHVVAARKALSRHKEKKGFTYINSMGTTLFDNKNPAGSIFGTCTGRNAVGAGNGSCRMEDLVRAFSHIMLQGFMPNVIMMHPLAWSIWLTDPVLQTITKNTGNGAWFLPHTGPKATTNWDAANQNKMGMSGGFSHSTATPGTADVDQLLQSKPTIPGYFPYPLTVLVSPYVPFDAQSQLSDIMLFDSSELGALITKEQVMVEAWDDQLHDISNIKFRERYGFGIYNDGLGIGVLRNVPVVPNEIAFPVQPTISAAGDGFAVLDPSTAVL